MLTEMIELGWKMKEQMKDTQDEIKQNIQGTNSDRKETRTQINDSEQKEEITIQPEQNEETRIQKKWRETYEPLGQPEKFQYPNYRGARRTEFVCGKWGKWWKVGREPSKRHCPFSNLSPTDGATTQQSGLPHLGEYLMLHPLLHNRLAERKKKKKAQMKEQIKVQKKYN